MQTICMDGKSLKNYLQMVLNRKKFDFKDFMKIIKNVQQNHIHF